MSHLQRNIIEHMDVSDVGDVTDVEHGSSSRSTHQLVESNVIALENISHDGLPRAD